MTPLDRFKIAAAIIERDVRVGDLTDEEIGQLLAGCIESCAQVIEQRLKILPTLAWPAFQAVLAAMPDAIRDIRKEK